MMRRFIQILVCIPLIAASPCKADQEEKPKTTLLEVLEAVRWESNDFAMESHKFRVPVEDVSINDVTGHQLSELIEHESCQPSNVTEVFSFPTLTGVLNSDFPVNCEVSLKITEKGKGTIQSVKCSDERFKQNTIDAIEKVIWRTDGSGALCKVSDDVIIYPVVYDMD